MGMFLNSRAPYEAYREMRQDDYFVDKSMLIGELLPALGRKNRYFCITRPRRFGKTVMANMVGAFFAKTEKADSLFEGLKIMEAKEARAHLHQHDVIYIDFSRLPEGSCSYDRYIARITDSLKEDILCQFPDLEQNPNHAVWDMLQKVFDKTDRKFIFIIDEWDAIFHMSFVTLRERQEYLLFLRNLLKDQPYVELVYMTGILPIAKYSDGSAQDQPGGSAVVV